MLDVRRWDEVSEGAALADIVLPITVHRLVVEAGGNRDFATVHHNADAARATGAPDCFANNVFIQGMFERVAREYIGLSGIIRKIGPFRMHGFLLAGTTAVVSGSVARKWLDGDRALAELKVKCVAGERVTASGLVTVELPR